MAKINPDEVVISNSIPFKRKHYEILKKLAIIQHRTLRKTVQIAVQEYIVRNIKELEKDDFMIG